jgi:hypothetical protein
LNDKPYQVFDIIKLRVSKNFKMYKEKYVFGAKYNKEKDYLIGF